MRNILLGFLIGGAWAFMQWSRDSITDPIALAVPIVLCGAFGGLMWGARILMLKYRGKRR